MNLRNSVLEQVEASAAEFGIPIGRTEAQQLYTCGLVGFDFPGCYMAMSGKDCLYVGSSQNIRRRFTQHFVLLPEGRFWICNGCRLYSASKAPIKSIIIAIESDEPKMLERLLILKWRPKHNSKLTGKPEHRPSRTW